MLTAVKIVMPKIPVVARIDELLTPPTGYVAGLDEWTPGLTDSPMVCVVTTLGGTTAAAVSSTLAVFTAAALMLGQCSGGTSPATANARAIKGHGSQYPLFGAISAFP
jgi:hypothetical protein